MAKINKKDILNMNQEDLKTRLVELRKELIKENAQIAVGTTPKSPGYIKQLKKTIARIIQILNIKKEVQKSNE
jgi:large subunit ribosomal protein L29